MEYRLRATLLLAFSLIIATPSAFSQSVTSTKPEIWLNRYNSGFQPVDQGDTLGTIRFRGLMQNGDFRTGASIVAYTSDSVFQNNIPTHLKFKTGAPFLQDRMIILENGNVGIGLDKPEHVLDIKGNARVIGAMSITEEFEVAKDFSALSNLSIGNNLLVNNKIGIGLSQEDMPEGYRLVVSDGILAEKVKVAVKNTTDWADHVLEPNYPLPPLSEVASFIQKNGHLPNIPPAKEVVNNGLDLAQMDALLLQKIEELTLYILELKNENDELKKAIEQLKK